MSAVGTALRKVIGRSMMGRAEGGMASSHELCRPASLRRADTSWDMHHKKTVVIWGARAGVPGKTTSAKAQKWG